MNWWDIINQTVRAALVGNVIWYALAALGLNLHFGYAGLLNFGQVGFVAVGAYGMGISSEIYGLPLPLSILIGLLAGVVLALLLGVPTLRLRADYLAIVTIASGEILRLALKSTTLRGFSGGSAGVPHPADEFLGSWNPFSSGKRYGFKLDFYGNSNVQGGLDLTFTGNDLWQMIVGWSLILICVAILWRLVNSPWGRVVKSIREDEDAARSLGKNVFRFKMQALVLGGVFGSLGGIFWSMSINTVQPDNFSTPFTFFALTAAIIGGLGRVWGPVIGSMIFWVVLTLIENVLRNAVAADKLPESLISGVQVGQVRYILMGLGLMLLMIFRPQGVFGDKREIAIDARK